MSASFRLSDTPTDGRLDLVRHVVGDTVVPLEIHPSVGPSLMDDEMHAEELGALRLTEHKISPAVVQRTSKLIRQSDPEFCKIDFIVSGKLLVEQSDRQSVLYPGDLALLNLSRPCRWVGSNARVVVLVFPRWALPLRDSDLERLVANPISSSTGPGALIPLLTQQILRDVGSYTAAERVGVGSSVLDLLLVTLKAHIGDSDQLASGTRQQALVTRIYAFIEERLADPTLSTRTIAMANHISVRYLQKLFEAEGVGVATLIRRRRLDRCRRDLVDPSLRTHKVAAIGARWGFTDPIQFNRVFRRTYGVPPGAYRQMSADAGLGNTVDAPTDLSVVSPKRQ